MRYEVIGEATEIPASATARTSARAILVNGVPAWIGGFAAAAAAGLGLMPAALVAVGTGLGYLILRRQQPAR